MIVYPPIIIVMITTNTPHIVKEMGCLYIPTIFFLWAAMRSVPSANGSIKEFNAPTKIRTLTGSPIVIKDNVETAINMIITHL